jgi:hypothetical protein
MNAWAQQNWKFLAAFTIGVLIGAISVRQGYEGVRIADTEYSLLKKPSIPQSLSLVGRWFYKTETSGPELSYDTLKCVSILGFADISQGQDGSAVSNEFSVDNAVRRACIDNRGETQKTNISWTSNIASVLPDSRRLIIALSTNDTPPRIGYIEGAIPVTDTGATPKKFLGRMFYLNTKDRTYGNTTIEFCKEGTDCARSIEKQLP